MPYLKRFATEMNKAPITWHKPSSYTRRSDIYSNIIWIHVSEETSIKESCILVSCHIICCDGTSGNQYYKAFWECVQLRVRPFPFGRELLSRKIRHLQIARRFLASLVIVPLFFWFIYHVAFTLCLTDLFCLFFYLFILSKMKLFTDFLIEGKGQNIETSFAYGFCNLKKRSALACKLTYG